MSEKTDKRKPKAPPTPQQAEIARLRQKGRDKRTDQESARLDQLVSQERRERFLRLAPRRVQAVLDSLRRLSACANPAGYQFTEDEAAKIKASIDERVSAVFAAFSTRTEEETLFKL